MKKIENLRRLMAPSSVAFFGGKSMIGAVQRCRQGGFQGDVWLVNPKHSEIDGEPCFNSVAGLPGIVDAAFVGTNNETTVSIVEQLNNAGAGGVVCYASGFAEAGETGKKMQNELIKASGDMALLGPNCYGLLDYLHNSALWPVAHGGKQVEKGVAILTQSGNFAYNLSMIDRSLPTAYLISVGNEASLDMADLIEALLDEPRVTAIGLHMEGLNNVNSFAKAAMKALKKGVPIIAMKTCTSSIGAELAIGHTSSLAGTDELYNALFDRLGIIRVSGPVSFMETMKVATCGQLPKGSKVAALACSGGDAALIADYSEINNLQLPQLNQKQKEKFQTVLPEFANIANPLDFTTVIWGNESALRTCTETMLDSDVDFGFLILDYPTEESGEREQCDLMADVFQQTLMKLGLPGAVASSFPELMPKATRDRLHSHGIPALQGVEDGLAAIARVMQYNICREQILTQSDGADQILIPGPINTDGISIDEWESKKQLSEYGLKIPDGRLVNKDQVKEAAEELGCPVAIKIASHEIQHKTEMGAVSININSPEEAVKVAEEMVEKVSGSHPNLDTKNLLVEKMSKKPVAELLIGIKREQGFGFALVIGSGGTMVELSQDTTTLLLPTNKEAVEQALKKLKIAKVLEGFRGQALGDIESTVKAIMAVAKYANAKADSLLELDVNPLMVMNDGAIAVDAYIRLASKN